MYSNQILLDSILEKDVVKTGNFTLKNGETSSVYLDFRSLISYPSLLEEVTEKITYYSAPLNFELVCGVPYTALSLATCFSLMEDIPQILCRKEPKAYGTKQQIEGCFKVGQHCLLLEDVITTGSSVLKVAHLLGEAGLKVTDVITLVDREATGKETLKQAGINLHSLFTLSEVETACQKLQLH